MLSLEYAKLDLIDNEYFNQQISSMPTVKAFHKGEVVDGFIGVQHAEFVKEFVERTGSLAN